MAAPGAVPVTVGLGLGTRTEVELPSISPLKPPERRLPTFSNTPVLTIFPRWVEVPVPSRSTVVMFLKSNNP